MDNEMDYENITFTTVNKDGLEVVCDLLSSYYDEVNDRLYFAFTDYSLNNDNKFNSYIVEAIKSQNGYDLVEIDDLEIRNKLVDLTLGKEM